MWYLIPEMARPIPGSCGHYTSKYDAATMAEDPSRGGITVDDALLEICQYECYAIPETDWTGTGRRAAREPFSWSGRSAGELEPWQFIL